MGVINITPNSFSDGGDYTSHAAFTKKFNGLLDWADIIDIGAESTAPFNEQIGAELELSRFEEYLFPYVAATEDPETTLSIDSYRPEVFYEVGNFLNTMWPKTNLIFNDVSGKIDEDLLELLKDKKLKFDYVFCHNLCDNRSNTSKHMDFTSPNLAPFVFIEAVIFHLNEGYKKLNQYCDKFNLNRKIYLDPCFGFSKTRFQNQLLLKHMDTLISGIPASASVLYGISRKSFLRIPEDMDAKLPENKMILDAMQSVLVYELLKENKNTEFILRTHDPVYIFAALNVFRL